MAAPPYRLVVGVPHVHADDLDLLPVFHPHQVVGHYVLTTAGQQVDQSFLFGVGEDAEIMLVQVLFADA